MKKWTPSKERAVRHQKPTEALRALAYLKKLLADGGLSPARRRLVEAEIRELEKARA